MGWMADPPRPTAAPWKRRLPNRLTGARLALAVVFFAVLSVAPAAPSHWWAPAVAAGVFVIAAVTDALDGYLARRWDAGSQFGRIMDPFADKVLVLGAFVMLASPLFASAEAVPGGGLAVVPISGVEPWMVVVMLARELLITSLRGLIESRGGDFSASASGKIKMVAQSVAAPLILLMVSLSLRRADLGEDLRLACSVAAWAATIITAWSALPYIARAMASLPESR